MELKCGQEYLSFEKNVNKICRFRLSKMDSSLVKLFSFLILLLLIILLTLYNNLFYFFFLLLLQTNNLFMKSVFCLFIFCCYWLHSIVLAMFMLLFSWMPHIWTSGICYLDIFRNFNALWHPQRHREENLINFARFEKKKYKRTYRRFISNNYLLFSYGNLYS